VKEKRYAETYKTKDLCLVMELWFGETIQ